MDRRRWAVRSALLVGILIGAYTLALMVVGRPDWLGVDYLVYELAARAALAGDPFYDIPPPGFGFTYVYPPITVLLFVPLAVLPGWKIGFALFTLTELAACAGIAIVVDRLVRTTGEHLARADRLLVGVFAAGSAAAIPNLFYAQINHHLALLIGAGLLALEAERAWLSGVLIGIAALFKIFPAALAAWFIRRRSWIAVIAAVGTGLVGLGAGVLVFGPDTTLTYLDAALLGRLEASSNTAGVPAGAPYVSLRRATAAIWPGHSLLVTVVPLLVVAGPLGLLYRDVSSPLRRLLAAHVTVVGMLVVIPAYVVYLVLVYPTLLALAYRLRGWPQYSMVAATLLVGIAYTPAAVRGHLDRWVIGEVLLPIVEPLLVFGSPPLYGLLLSIVGCVGVWYRLETTSTR